jgi:hypothetical protein
MEANILIIQQQIMKLTSSTADTSQIYSGSLAGAFNNVLSLHVSFKRPLPRFYSLSYGRNPSGVEAVDRE